MTRAQLAVSRQWPREIPDELFADEITWINRAIRRERFIRISVAAIMLLISALAGWAIYEKAHATKVGHAALLAEKGIAETSATLAATNSKLAESESERANVEARQAREGKVAFAQAELDAGIMKRNDENESEAAAHFARALRLNPANCDAVLASTDLLSNRHFLTPVGDPIVFPTPLEEIAFSDDSSKFLGLHDETIELTQMKRHRGGV